MKRRKFIVTTGLSAIAIGLAPMALTGRAGRSNTGAIELPSTSSQIRHGMYSPEQTSFVQLGDGLKIYGKQIFYKNGIEDGDADLVNITFEIDGDVHCITCIGERVFIGDVECFAKPDEKFKIIEKNGKTVSFLQGNGTEKKQIQIAGHLILIYGDIVLNGETLDGDFAIKLNERLNLGSDGKYNLIIIDN